MAHCVQAFIGRRPALEKIQQRFAASLVVDLEQGTALLPLVEQLYDAVPESEVGQAWPSSDRFEFLSPKIGRLLVETSREASDAIAYMETDYFGGSGVQGAIAVSNGDVVFGPAIEDNAINVALRALGVRKISAHDEFDEIGLGRFRSNETWISQPRRGRD